MAANPRRDLQTAGGYSNPLARDSANQQNKHYVRALLGLPPVYAPQRPQPHSQHASRAPPSVSSSETSDRQLIVATPVVLPSKRRLRGSLLLKTFASLQLITAVYMALTGLTCAIITFDRKEPWFYTPLCLYGSALYVGVLGILTAIVGFIAVTFAPQCLLCTYLVLSLLTAVGAIVETMLAAIWSHDLALDVQTSRSNYHGDRDVLGLVQTNQIVNPVVCVAAFLNAVASIVTLTLMCINVGCCCEEGTRVAQSKSDGGTTDFDIVCLGNSDGDIGKTAELLLVPRKAAGAPRYTGEPSDFQALPTLVALARPKPPATAAVS